MTSFIQWAVRLNPTSASAAKKAVRAQTFKFSFWLRSQLRYEAWLAKGEESWWKFLFWPQHSSLRRLLFGPQFRRQGFEEYFTINAPLFGEAMYEEIKLDISSRLARGLENLIDSKGEPFLIIRAVFSRRFFEASLTSARKDDREKAEALLEADNVAASGLIAATKTILRRKLDTDTPYHDYFTEVSTENNRFDDRRDMHLHYRTATPKLPPGIAGLNTAARIIVFTCIENPLADPIYLIRADDVISAIPPIRGIFCMSQISISSIDGPLTATCNSSRVVTSAFCTAGPIGYHSTQAEFGPTTLMRFTTQRSGLSLRAFERSRRQVRARSSCAGATP